MSEGRARPNWLPPVLVAAVAAMFVAFLGATVTDLGDWYQHLKKPGWTPPGPAFGIIWTIVFTTTAVAGVTAWRGSRTTASSDLLVGMFAMNGFLNILWSLIFFRMQRPDWAFGELMLLWLSIVLLLVACWRRSRVAGLLILPYLAWVTAAGALNWQIVALNGPFG
ncbi:TspO/MBR family protein [Sphingomonas sp. ASV193]|uniref:TspO/MBR family protein n=1 Tax=Sphingomonas sp. ASV193 TaxID=3144405 RepID=UPI0032E85C14